MKENQNSMKGKVSFMKAIKHRLLAALLVGTLLLSLVTPAFAEEEFEESPVLPQSLSESEAKSATGSITATLRFDYPQTIANIQDRNISMELLAEGKSIGSVKLAAQSVQETKIGAYPAVLTLKNTDGIPVTTETQVGYLELVISDLPLGNYALAFHGEGYQDYTVADVQLEDFSQHVVLGTSDVFLLGDVTNDEKVDKKDVDHLALTLKESWDVDGESALCDLNGDGALDISDLAYVTRQASVTAGKAEVRSTSLIDPLKTVTVPSDQVNMTTGEISDLFQGGREVTFATTDSGDTSKIDIPLEFRKEGLPLQQLQLITPAVDGAVEAGYASVTYLDEDNQEKTKQVKFGGVVPADVQFLSRSGTNNTITIDLGKKVAVKKVTITVTKVTGQDGTVSFVVLEQIKFLQDIVPENPVAPNSKVKSVATFPGNGEITLKWPELPNVTGYRVDNIAAGGGEETVPPVTVNSTTATVTGLENLIAYTFTVTPLNENGDETWEGFPSEPVTATPQPSAIPNPPDFLTIVEQKGALLLSWGKTDNANYYEVFYKASDENAFTQWGGKLTTIQALLSGLKNGVEYELYVKAGNDLGLSGESRHVVATPKDVDYNEPAGIPKDGRISSDLLSKIVLTDPNNVSASQYPNGTFDVRWVADGDYKTHWTSQSYNDGNWSRSKEIQFTFSQPQDISSVVYVPRLDGTYRNNLRNYSITVWDAEGNKTVLVNNAPVRNSPRSTGFAVLPIAPTKGITRMDVAVEQEAYSAVSLSEIIFLTYDPSKDLDIQIAALFSDESRTTLADGVTKAHIDSLSQVLTGVESYYLYPDAMRDELALAGELLAGQSVGRVLKGVESRGNSEVNQGQGGSLLQPMGVAALDKQQITIYASGIPEGETVSLTATQFFAEANAWSAPVAELSNGRNVVTIPKIGSQNTQRGGSLYFTYSGEGAEAITLHVRRATKIPLLDLANPDLTAEEQRTRITDYLKELKAYKNPDVALNATEISFPSTLLSIHADKAKEALYSVGVSDPVETLYQSLLAWNELMETAYRTQGIDDSSKIEVRQNIRTMQMFGGAFMYAAGNHVGVGSGSCGGLLMGQPTATTGNAPNKLFGWGIAHEVGHNMDKLGKAEITNNIYSLVMQTRDNGSHVQTSRLEGETYERVFDKTAASYPGASSNGAVALAMYWQLHLAYDDGNESFWNAFFKAWKSLPAGGSYDDNVALAAAQASGYDMTAFFTRWGMTLSAETKKKLAEYQKDTRAIWYLSDASRRDRLAGGSLVSGSITATATLQPAGEGEVQNKVEITVNPDGITDSGRIQGYEILRNGKSVAFSTKHTYTEVIGSANNIAYSYTVQAYDILGNKVGEAAQAGQVRIAYDKTIDTKVERTDNVFTANLGKSVAVSGVKISLPSDSANTLPSTGFFTVEVVENGEKRTAKTGDFAKNDAVQGANSYIAYFTKPGADAADTRIWTFDADSITLTDTSGTLPNDAVVQFISYAGDDVGFYTSGENLGPAGKLKADFTYSDNGEQVVIPAGTVVITGTYRGDPLYNTIRIKGEYVTSTVNEDGNQTSKTTGVPLPGYSLLFAEIPADGAVSDISDGFFLFVPDMEALKPLLEGLTPATSGNAHDCTLGDWMPARIQAELRRTDTPDGAAGTARLTASTLWLPTASYDTLPQIELKGDSAQ